MEGLATQFENGEDGVYSLMVENDKNTIFQPKISITAEDVETIPFLAQLRESIADWEKLLKKSSGKQAYLVKKSLIEMRKDQYVIKQGYKKPILFKKMPQTSYKKISLPDLSYVDPDTHELVVRGLSFMSPKIVSLILQHYSRLVEDSHEDFLNDTWYLMQDFSALCGRALADYPDYEAIVLYKIDGLQNQEIQQRIKTPHSIEYISSLWRNKIPKLIAECAKREFLEFEYRQMRLPLKKCSRCGQKKPAHHIFFSKNKTSKDGYYSICRSCRAAKYRMSLGKSG